MPACTPAPAVPDPQIPEDYRRDLAEFLESGKSGQVVLHVVKGQVVGIDCTAIRRDRDRVATA